MAVTFAAEQVRPSGGVTLAQLAELVERALRECQEFGQDPTLVEPKTLSRVGGKIKKISMEI
jgi:hypothetical protein